MVRSIREGIKRERKTEREYKREEQPRYACFR